MSPDFAPAPDAGPGAEPAPPASAFGRFVDGLSGAGSLVIAAMMVMVVADVVARNVLDRPITGVTELVALGVVVVLFLQLASALRHGRLSRAEIFIDGLRARRPRAGAALQALLHGCGALFCAVVCAATLTPLRKAWTDDDFVGVAGVFTAPTWPMLAVTLLGSAVSALQFALLALAELRAAHAGARP